MLLGGDHQQTHSFRSPSISTNWNGHSGIGSTDDVDDDGPLLGVAGWRQSQRYQLTA
jgi:hypothetical protein